jgi:hypothetical protein
MPFMMQSKEDCLIAKDGDIALDARTILQQMKIGLVWFAV